MEDHRDFFAKGTMLKFLSNFAPFKTKGQLFPPLGVDRKSIIATLVSAAFLFYCGSFAFNVFFKVVRSVTIKRISKGLSSSERFAEQLTGARFDEHFKTVPLTKESL